jgi:cytoskeleton protein RodZ
MADIGTTLREARMRSRIDISEVEARTKIRAKYLRAIENEEWDLLPGDVYVKSFLRTYGDFLGLDSRMLVDEFKRRYEHPSDQELRPISSLGRDRPDRPPRGPLLPSWALIGIVLVAIVVALYALGSGGGGGGGKSGASSTSHAGARHRHRAARPTATTAPRAPKSVTLRLVATAPVYVCLVDAAGKQLIPGKIFDAGQTIPTQTASKMLLTLGNASVKMTVNGKPVTVTPSASSIGFTLEPTGTFPLAGPQQPRCA